METEGTIDFLGMRVKYCISIFLSESVVNVVVIHTRLLVNACS